ncbi:hypothetical protein [Hymenobacter cavernae]|uniref:Cysteinyl-tRNA synthetase n=1 Tax=Hymenobacter cavernae TaxID=2044852 RepID=A0ABQ1U469_9BACT|nr:hypothetical protein [Hymenobacter cavernae]GGF10506.1 hypothetical protein GCM10011383_22090 [Hymenobacter cavernae]
MQAFDEGSIRFTFPDSWFVLKYDDCPYYRGPVVRTGTDAAAVDFIVASPTQPATLILIEVKDFRRYEVENRSRLVSGDLATEVARKVLDSLGALFVGARANYAELRPFASMLLLPPDQIQVVLLLEEDQFTRGSGNTRSRLKQDTQLKRRGDLLQDLKTKLKPFRISPSLHDAANVPTQAGWSAVAFPITLA